MPESQQNTGGTSWTMTEQEQHIHVIVQDAIRSTVQPIIRDTIEEQRKSFDPGRYLTFTQGILGVIVTIIGFMVGGYGYMSSVQSQIELGKERMTKLEYQAQISIDDRHDIHTRLDHTDLIISEINQRLARIDTKLDEIKARQSK